MAAPAAPPDAAGSDGYLHNYGLSDEEDDDVGASSSATITAAAPTAPRGGEREFVVVNVEVV